jgi:4-hydroxybenzoate polyprenyltransferase
VLRNLAWPYWIGVGIIALLLAVEHRLISADDLSLLHTAYFRVNSLVSTVFLIFVLWALSL